MWLNILNVYIFERIMLDSRQQQEEINFLSHIYEIMQKREKIQKSLGKKMKTLREKVFLDMFKKYLFFLTSI